MAYYYHHGLLLLCNLRCARDARKREDVGCTILLLGYSMLTNQRRRGSLEGQQTPVPFSTLVQHPELRHIGSNQR